MRTAQTKMLLLLLLLLIVLLLLLPLIFNLEICLFSAEKRVDFVLVPIDLNSFFFFSAFVNFVLSFGVDEGEIKV